MRWFDTQPISRDKALDRFCHKFGIDVVKQGDVEYLLKNARPIRSIRWAKRPRELRLQAGAAIRRIGRRLSGNNY